MSAALGMLLAVQLATPEVVDRVAAMVDDTPILLSEVEHRAEPEIQRMTTENPDPQELALALLSAVQGGLLLAKTTHSNRPLEIALDMALDHVTRHTTRR